jgi:hypothetical protein
MKLQTHAFLPSCICKLLSGCCYPLERHHARKPRFEIISPSLAPSLHSQQSQSNTQDQQSQPNHHDQQGQQDQQGQDQSPQLQRRYQLDQILDQLDG